MSDPLEEKLRALAHKFVMAHGNRFDGDDRWQRNALVHGELSVSLVEAGDRLTVALYGKPDELGWGSFYRSSYPAAPGLLESAGYWVIYSESPDQITGRIDRKPEFYQRALDVLQRAMILDTLGDV